MQFLASLQPALCCTHQDLILCPATVAPPASGQYIIERNNAFCMINIFSRFSDIYIYIYKGRDISIMHFYSACTYLFLVWKQIHCGTVLQFSTGAPCGGSTYNIYLNDWIFSKANNKGITGYRNSHIYFCWYIYIYMVAHMTVKTRIVELVL